MRIFEAREVRERLPWLALIEALRAMFKAGCGMPERTIHEFPVEGEPDGSLLLMTAWSGERLGIKVLTLMEGNARRDMPTIEASYLLKNARTGETLAIMDGSEITARRTPAASALAASYLARPESSRLLVLGTGALAANLPHAHAAVRPIREVAIWGRDRVKAAALATRLTMQGFDAQPTDDLKDALRWADIISAATGAAEPIIRGDWLRPGAHVDLIGAYKPNTRECDDGTVLRSTLFADERGHALEAGDLAIPLGKGLIKVESIQADLYDLTRGLHPGRRMPDEITLFKSSGLALEDLAAANLVYDGALT